MFQITKYSDNEYHITTKYLDTDYELTFKRDKFVSKIITYDDFITNINSMEEFITRELKDKKLFIHFNIVINIHPFKITDTIKLLFTKILSKEEIQSKLKFPQINKIVEEKVAGLIKNYIKNPDEMIIEKGTKIIQLRYGKSNSYPYCMNCYLTNYNEHNIEVKWESRNDLGIILPKLECKNMNIVKEFNDIIENDIEFYKVKIQKSNTIQEYHQKLVSINLMLDFIQEKNEINFIKYCPDIERERIVIGINNKIKQKFKIIITDNITDYKCKIIDLIEQRTQNPHFLIELLD
jgi:hypothetical protein